MDLNFQFDVDASSGTTEIVNQTTGSNNPYVWHTTRVSGGPSISGIRVNDRTTLQHTPIWQGLNVVCGDIGMLPYVVVRRRGDTSEELPRHAAARVLRNPNKIMTSDVFREVMQYRAELWGNGYAAIMRNEITSRPEELLPLLPWETWPEWDDDGRLYIRTRLKSEVYKFPYDDVLDIKGGLTQEGILGSGILQFQRDAIGHGIAARNHSSSMFRNSARVPIVLKTTGRMSPEQRHSFRKEWRELHAGSDNSGNVGILPSGMDVETLGMTAVEAQLIEERRFSVHEAAAILNIPPHKLGALDRATYRNIEEQNRDYLQSSLARRLNRWRQECRRKLLNPLERQSTEVDFVWRTEAFLRGDILTRYQAYKIARDGEWMSANDVRRAEDRNPIGPEGDVYRNPNTRSDASPEPEPPADEEDDQVENTVRRLMNGVCEDMAKIERERLSRGAKDGPADYAGWIREFYDRDFRKVLAPRIPDEAAAAYCNLRREQVLEYTTDGANGYERFRDEDYRRNGAELAKLIWEGTNGHLQSGN